MYGIEVRKTGAGLLVELWGEFDVFCIGEMKRILDEASSCRGPVLVDLSGITFLDLRSAREIAIRSMLRTHRPTFLDPSPQVTATMTALGLEGWPYVPAGSEATSASSRPHGREAGSGFLYVSPSRT